MSKYFIIPVLLAFFSCRDQDLTFDIGSKYVDVQTNLQYIDTLTVSSYTVSTDSIYTSGLQKGIVLAGMYHDPEIGDISSASYFNLGLPPSRTLPKDAVFDSICLVMIDNNYSIGDTMKQVALEVHRLTEALKAGDENRMYNHSAISYNPEIFGSVAFIPRPNRYDTLSIRLDNAFGVELFELIRTKDDRVSNMDNFLGYFKGLMIKTGGIGDAILGFSSENGFPAMRIYYHYFDFSTVHKTLDFANYNVTLQFNRFEITNPVESWPARQSEKLPSSLSGNRTFVQGGTGLVTRLEFPFLRKLLELHENIQILKAELIVEPARNTYKTIPLPANVSLYTTDRLNRLGTILRNSFTGDIETGVLVIDKVYQEETTYTFDVTQFLNSKLFEQSDDIPALLMVLSPEDFNSFPERLVIGSQLNADNKTKLKIYYMNYE